MNFKVATIILNYNSYEDTIFCYNDLKKQKNINMLLILVDNASTDDSRKRLMDFFKNKDFALFTEDKNLFEFLDKDKVYNHPIDTILIFNSVNKGYSAGNNIGIKIADYLNIDLVLIANPDMRFHDPFYLQKLVETISLDEDFVIAASRIINLQGEEQNPLREPNFFEELFWPSQTIRKFFNKKTTYILPYNNEIMFVPKVQGCCLMLRIDFLKKIGYLDENLFLYSEEAVLAAQVKKLRKKIVFNPKIYAIHEHKNKGNNSKRMLLMIKSRKYYLKNYSNYNAFQIVLLDISYSLLTLVHWIKCKFLL